MASTTIRISDVTHEALQRLTRAREETMGQIVAEAVARFERDEALASLNAAYARLAADPVAAADWQAELEGLDATLLDGLADDPWVE